MSCGVSLGRRRPISRSLETGLREGTESISEDTEEGFISPFFQLTEDSPEVQLGASVDQEVRRVGPRSSIEEEADDRDDGDFMDVHSFLQNAKGKERRPRKASRKGKAPSYQAPAVGATDEAAGAFRSGQATSMHRQPDRPPSASSGGAKGDYPDEPIIGDSFTDTFPGGTVPVPPVPPSNEEHAPCFPDAVEGGRTEPDGSDATGGIGSRRRSSQTTTKKNLREALSRARREGALAADSGFRAQRSVGTEAEPRKGKHLGVTAATPHDAVPHYPQGFHNEAPPLKSSFSQAGTATELRSWSETRDVSAKQKNRSNSDILFLPADKGTAGVSPGGTSLRPVRSLAELRKLQRQQGARLTQKESRAQLGAGRRNESPAQEPEATHSAHRQILNVVRRLHEQRGHP